MNIYLLFALVAAFDVLLVVSNLVRYGDDRLAGRPPRAIIAINVALGLTVGIGFFSILRLIGGGQ